MGSEQKFISYYSQKEGPFFKIIYIMSILSIILGFVQYVYIF
jgi:hypothetical protein